MRESGNYIDDARCPRVSICMVTYNHEKYISQAIESVLMQELNFDIELIVADDCSTDKTQAIIQELISSHPRGFLINYVRHPKNIGMIPNFISSLKQAKGQFIALCDGDDYWTDPLKLQKQVDFLEKSPDFAIHFMNASVVDEHSKLVSKKLCNHNRTTFSLADFFTPNNPIVTLTALFRNIVELQSKDFKKIIDYPYGDWGLWVFVLYHSGLNVKYEDEVAASYRVHDGGVFSKKKATETLRKIIRIHELNLINFEKIDKQQIRSTICELKNKLFRELLLTDKKAAFFYYCSNFRALYKSFSIRDFLYALRNY